MGGKLARARGASKSRLPPHALDCGPQRVDLRYRDQTRMAVGRLLVACYNWRIHIGEGFAQLIKS